MGRPSQPRLGPHVLLRGALGPVLGKLLKIGRLLARALTHAFQPMVSQVSTLLLYFGLGVMARFFLKNYQGVAGQKS